MPLKKLALQPIYSNRISLIPNISVVISPICPKCTQHFQQYFELVTEHSCVAGHNVVKSMIQKLKLRTSHGHVE